MLKATAIPYKSFKEKIKIVEEERNKNRHVTVDDRNVYSFPRNNKRKVKQKDGKSSRTFKNFKCGSCDSKFRITTTIDVQYAMCPGCGGVNVDYMEHQEEKAFDKYIG